MVSENCMNCPDCGTELKYYDTVKRVIKGKYGKKTWIYICRKKCPECNKYHRVLPDCVIPFRHYEKEIVSGVLQGLIDISTIGYEDYPMRVNYDKMARVLQFL